MPSFSKEAYKKYKDGTRYKDPEGRTRRRVSSPWTARGDAYCARSAGQKQTEKVKVRRFERWCKWKKSFKRK